MTVQSALHFTSLTDLFTQTPSQLLWEASSHMLQLMREGCSYTYPPLSIARYSFIQLSELEQCRVKKLAQGFNCAAQDSNPFLIVKSLKLYPSAIALYSLVPTMTHYPWLTSNDGRLSNHIEKKLHFLTPGFVYT